MATNRIDKLTPFLATSPMEIVRDEIKARGISQNEFATRMGMQPSNVSRMFKEKSAITVPMAKKLEKALDINADFWLRLQTTYEKDLQAISARDEKEEAARHTEQMISSLLNLPEIYSRLHVKASLFIQDKLEKFGQALGYNPVLIAQGLCVRNGAYKKSDKCSDDERNENTWAVLAYISAKKHRPAHPYVKGNARKAAQEIAAMTHKGEGREQAFAKILDNYGISYSVVKKLEKTPIDGYSAWVEGHPAVVTTHRYNDMARLVFNILHELGHIELHLKEGSSTAFITNNQTYSSDALEERQADEFAENMLIDKTLWASMMNNSYVTGLWADNIVKKLKLLSKENHLDFNIVAWRYKYETNQYNLRGIKSSPIQ